MPALQAALALTEVHRLAVRVGQHLDLDMPRGGDQPFDEQRVITEGSAGLPAGAGDGLEQVLCPVHHPHALATAASGRLEQHGVPDLPGRNGQPIIVEACGVATGHHRDASGRHGLLGTDLVAHRLNRGSRGADEYHPGLSAGSSERGVLRQEPIAWMYGLRAGARDGVQDPLDREVAAGRGRRAEPDGDVGVADMSRVGVSVAVHGNRSDTHGAQRADHPDRNLASVGHQHRLEHARSLCEACSQGRTITAAGLSNHLTVTSGRRRNGWVPVAHWR